MPEAFERLPAIYLLEAAERQAIMEEAMFRRDRFSKEGRINLARFYNALLNDLLDARRWQEQEFDQIVENYGPQPKPVE